MPTAGSSDASVVDLSDPGAYGRSFSDTYDSWYATVTDAAATARFVAARTAGGVVNGGGVVLELGAGTGRLAAALRAEGLTVVGLDASAEMLRRCPSEVHRLLGDMARPPLRPGAADIALCGFNTLFNLASERQQRQMFRRLRPVVATVVLETAVFSPLDAAPADRPLCDAGLKEHRNGSVVVTTTSSGVDHQSVAGCHLEISDTEVVSRPWLLRWATAAQLDEMAADAGFALGERYSSWTESPWIGPTDGGVAVSVYR